VFLATAAKSLELLYPQASREFSFIAPAEIGIFFGGGETRTRLAGRGEIFNFFRLFDDVLSAKKTAYCCY
jgi:hypothetical protein